MRMPYGEEAKMDLQVLVERVNEALYRASALTLSAEAATEEEAIEGLKRVLAQKVAAGAKVVTIPVPAAPAWARFVGTWKPDDPAIQDYLESVAEIRRKADEEENPI